MSTIKTGDYLAIGISHENEGFSASRFVGDTNRDVISALLHQVFGMEFDEILVVQNDHVVDHWREDR